ncbi:MAG: hypothetical protein K2N06_11740 [Oscillospiraceae bacterium]|nr:hypothetical protein [Oscillospiraceae bacterium]
MLISPIKENNNRLRIINLLLEQADSNIEDDYKLSGKYEGSFLNAVCRYLDRYRTVDEYIAEVTSSSDASITSSIRNAMYQLVLNQAVDALKDLERNSAMIFDSEF